MKHHDFNADSSASEKPLVTDQDTLRIYIGVLGFLLPIILPLWLFLYNHHTEPLNSISHYYYSRANSAFVITLGVLAVTLLVYQGKEPIDYRLSTVAAVSALFVVLLPTNIELKKATDLPAYYITFIADSDLRQKIHFGSAGIFLFCLALMAFFRFPRNNSSNEQPGPLDKFMYRTCGVIMAVAMLIIFLGVNDKLKFLSKEWFERNHGIFWGEAVAVWAFGYSWLLKAGFFGRFINRFYKML